MLTAHMSFDGTLTLRGPVQSQGFNHMGCLRMIPSYIAQAEQSTSRTKPVAQAEQRRIQIQVWAQGTIIISSAVWL